MFRRITDSPVLVRAVPFGVFLALTFLQDHTGEAGRYWMYLAKTVVGAMMLIAIWPHVAELKWKVSFPAIVVGCAVFVMWIGIDPWYPGTSHVYPSWICPLLHEWGIVKHCEPVPNTVPWNPNVFFGAGSKLALLFVIVRIVGSSLVVPPLEEAFWRSFLYRYLARRDFDAESLARFFPRSFILTSVLFGLAHEQWLAGILCGFAYQALVIWKGRIGDAMTAHAITNFLLGCWVVWKGAWQFW